MREQSNSNGAANDIELLQRVLDGDREAREDLAVRTAKIIYRMAYNKARATGLRRFNQQDAEDLVNDVLVSLFRNDARKLRLFRRESSYVRWIGVIVTHALIDRKRSKANKLEEASKSIHEKLGSDSDSPTREDFIEGLETDPHEKALYRCLVNTVREAQQKVLNEEEKLILDLWCTRRYTLNEMGLMLGKNPNTIATIIHRAQAKILKYVKKKEGDSVK